MEPRAELEKSAPPPPPAPFRSADNAVVSEAPLPVSKGDAVPAVKAEVAPPAPPPAAAPSQTKDASGAVGGVMRVVPAQAPRAVTGTTLARLSARDLYYRPAQASQFFGASSGTVRQFTPAPQGQQQQAVKGAEQQKKALDKAAEEALKTAAAPGAANLGVRYIVLRKSANGDFTEADPGELKTGDTVALRFETNDRGFLSVTARRAGATRVVFASPMERMTPRTTSPLRPEDAELLVAFSRQQQGYLVGAFTESPNHQQLAAGERATYVVGDQTAPQVRFTIRLVYK